MSVRSGKYQQILQGIVILCFMLSFAFLLFRIGFLDHPERFPVQILDDGWQIERNGVQEGTARFSATVVNDVRRGEVFTLTCRLPEEEIYPSAAVYFRALHAAVRVYADGNLIYEEGTKLFDAGKMVGRLICFVPLPADFEGKTFTVELTAAEDGAFYGFGPFSLGTEQDLLTRFLKEREIAFFVAAFLCVFGLMQLLWMPLLLLSDSKNMKLLFSALTTLVLGIYLMGYYNLIDLFTDLPNVNTMSEYLALYLIPCVMSGYIAATMTGWMRRMYHFFVAFDLCFIAAALAAHFSNRIHFTRFLYVSYATSFLEAAPFLVAITRRGWGRHRAEYYDRLEEMADRALSIGFFSYVLGSFTNAALFSFVKFMGGQEATVRIPFVTAGSLIFSFAICLHYFLYAVVNLRVETTKQMLRNEAYSDALTGLSNRTQCEHILDELGRRGARFTIISMDVDRLKIVNDTYGHTEGDRMLSGFADLLKECFAGCELIGRMGGDEFVVFLTDRDTERSKELLEKLHAGMDAHNRAGEGQPFYVSYGIAESSEMQEGQRARDVYMLADQRMYNMKRSRRTMAAGAEAAHES